MNDGAEHFKGLSYLLNLIDDKDEKKIRCLYDFEKDLENSPTVEFHHSVLEEKVKIVKYIIECCFFLSKNPDLFMNKDFTVLIAQPLLSIIKS